MNNIICIGREYGSGGKEIATELSKKLGIPFYDKELLEEALKDTDLPLDKLKNAEEHLANPFFHTVFYEGKNKDYYGMDASQILFKMQQKVILEKAKQGDCIFVGRCADFVLSECKDIHVWNIFIVAPIEDRVKRIMEREGVDAKTAVTKIRKTDKKRKAYYDYFTGKDWGKSSNYDFVLNTSSWGKEGCILMLKHLYNGTKERI